MKHRPLLLLAAVLAVSPLAGQVAAVSAGTVSRSPRERVLERMPAYDAEAAAAARETTATPDPDVVVLPELTVWERQQQEMAEESLYRRGHFDEELMRRELSDLDRSFLNRWRLPFVGIPNGIRAREAWLVRRRREFDDRVNRLADVVATTDPAEARALRASLNGWR